MKRDLLKPTADIVFKRIFGQEKEITIEFINLFVCPPQPVVDTTYLKQEMAVILNFFLGRLISAPLLARRGVFHPNYTFQKEEKWIILTWTIQWIAG